MIYKMISIYVFRTTKTSDQMYFFFLFLSDFGNFFDIEAINMYNKEPKILFANRRVVHDIWANKKNKLM